RGLAVPPGRQIAAPLPADSDPAAIRATQREHPGHSIRLHDACAEASYAGRVENWTHPGGRFLARLEGRWRRGIATTRAARRPARGRAERAGPRRALP